MSLVSVIIPAYNKSNYTCRAVDSVLKQTYSPIELIVVDDGSTDDTRERLAAYGDRIRYIHKQNGGACSARNHGIREAKGEFIALLDCDDLYLPSKIEVSVKRLQENRELGFVHTKAYLIDRDDKVIDMYVRHQNRGDGGWIARRLIFGNFVCNSTVVVRRACFDRAGFFDETIFTPADWDMWLRLAEQFQAEYIDMPLTKYRVADHYIFNKLELAQREESIAIERYFERNLAESQEFKNRVLSNLHVRFAQCYVVKDNNERVQRELQEALVLNPCNPKAWVVRVSNNALTRPFLKKFLQRKIMRYEN